MLNNLQIIYSVDDKNINLCYISKLFISCNNDLHILSLIYQKYKYLLEHIEILLVNLLITKLLCKENVCTLQSSNK